MSFITVTETFTHERLKLGGNSLRLITLYPDQNEYNYVYCDIQQHALHRRPGYIALSYMWGPIEEQYPIFLNGKRIDVRRNLYDCLVQLRKQHNEPITLWIDALCIDQDNITERNHVVQLMDQVYERSDMVYVWLGAADESSDRAMAFLVKVATEMENKTNAVDTFIETFMAPADYYQDWLAVLRLFMREYWHRLWIVQETLLAPSMDLFCGGHRISWKQLEQVVLLAKHSFDYFNRMRQGKSDLHAGILNSLAPRIVLQRCDSSRFTGRRDNFPSLQTLLENFKDSQCFDERDEIFGLLSIAGDLHHKRADYIDYNLSPSKVFVKFLQYSLETMSDVDDDETLYNVRRLSDALRLDISDILKRRTKDIKAAEVYDDLRPDTKDTSLAMPCSILLTFGSSDTLGPIISSSGILRDYFSSRTDGLQSPVSPSSPTSPKSYDEPSKIRDLAESRGTHICNATIAQATMDGTPLSKVTATSTTFKYFIGRMEKASTESRSLCGLVCSSSQAGDVLVKTLESDLYFVARRSKDKTYNIVGTAAVDETGRTREKVKAYLRNLWRNSEDNHTHFTRRTSSSSSAGLTSTIRPTSPLCASASSHLSFGHASQADNPNLITANFNPLMLLLIVNEPNWRKDHLTKHVAKIARRQPSGYSVIQPRGEDDPVHRSFGHRKFIGSAHFDSTANKWRDRASKKLEEMREFRDEIRND